jgi:hypothetical protein
MSSAIRCECGSEWFIEEQRIKIADSGEATSEGRMRAVGRVWAYRCGACGKTLDLPPVYATFDGFTRTV